MANHPGLGVFKAPAAATDGWEGDATSGMNRTLLLANTMIHLGVKDKDLNAPPPGPAEGDRYIVGPAPSGAWAGKAGQIAVWGQLVAESLAWHFVGPAKGMRAYLDDERAFYRYDQSWTRDRTWANAADYASIQAAIDAMDPTYGGTVYVPEGTYNITATITVPRVVHLRGAGEHQTIISMTTTNTDAILLAGDSGILSDMTVRTPNTDGTGRGVVVLKSGGLLFYPVIRNIVINQTQNWGLYLGNGTDVVIGLLVENVSITGNVRTSTGSLYVSPNCYATRCLHSTFNGNNTTGTYSGSGLTQTMGTVHLENCTWVTFIGCQFEPSQASTALSIKQSSSGISLYGCYFEMETTGARPWIITTVGGIQGLVLDNAFVHSHSTLGGIKLLKTDTANNVRGVVIRGGKMITAKVGGGTDDVVLGSVDDEVEIDTGDIVTDNVTWLPISVTVTSSGKNFTRKFHSKRLRLPLVTTAERDALPVPLEGDIVWNTTTKTLQRHNGTSWGDV